MDKDGDKNAERPKRPVLRPKKLDNKRAVNPLVVNNSLSSGNSNDFEDKDWWLQDLGVGTAVLSKAERPKRPVLRPKKLDNKRAVNPFVVNNSLSSGNSNDYEDRDWWLQDLGVGTAESDEGNARNIKEWNPACSNNHGIQNRKRGANVMESDSLLSNLDDQGSEGRSHCGGKKNIKRSRKSSPRKKSAEQKGSGKKKSGNKKKAQEDDSEEQGFNFFMKMLRAELISKNVSMSAQQVEKTGREIWKHMTSAQRGLFILLAALTKEKKSKECEKKKKLQSKEESDSKDDRNKKRNGRGKSERRKLDKLTGSSKRS